jgi:hypothetical protein
VTFVVPDSIEPVVGWRCFDVVDGVLFSPQQRMPWPPARKATAACSHDRWHYEWVQRTPRQRERMERKALDEGFTPEEGHFVRFQMFDGSIQEIPVYMPWGLRGRVPPVMMFPAEGKEWVLNVKTLGHPAPDQNCQCGIHLAGDLQLALQYRGHSAGAAVGRVKGWGKVIPANRGYRVEFAYPERIYLFNKPEGQLDLTPYGVPLASVLDCEEYLDAIGVGWRG